MFPHEGESAAYWLKFDAARDEMRVAKTEEYRELMRFHAGMYALLAIEARED